MFKLIALLCAAMFTVLLIAGEDRGQLRPGLANAPLVTARARAGTRAGTTGRAGRGTRRDTRRGPCRGRPRQRTRDRGHRHNARKPKQPLPKPCSRWPTIPQKRRLRWWHRTSPEPAGDVAYVDARSVNVREGPGTGNPVLTRLTRGEAVTIVSTEWHGLGAYPAGRRWLGRFHRHGISFRHGTLNAIRTAICPARFPA